MEEDIKKHCASDIKLIAGSGGIFKVSVDNQEIFSKQEQGRFPESAEILAKLK